ncbi:MAG: hypothetical protein AAFQ80_13445 [Cyanobacteria bacterium J06621_8]
MNQRQINFNAELIDNEIIIKLTTENGDRELAKQAASRLFSSLEKIGIEFTRGNLEKDWQNES